VLKPITRSTSDEAAKPPRLRILSRRESARKGL